MSFLEKCLIALTLVLMIPMIGLVFGLCVIMWRIIFGE